MNKNTVSTLFNQTISINKNTVSTLTLLLAAGRMNLFPVPA
jgi:hypothetical protein